MSYANPFYEIKEDITAHIDGRPTLKEIHCFNVCGEKVYNIGNSIYKEDSKGDLVPLWWKEDPTIDQVIDMLEKSLDNYLGPLERAVKSKNQ